MPNTLPRLTLRPAALDTFAVVTPSGAVLAIVPRNDVPAALAALRGVKPPSEARRRVRPALRLIAA